jgi:hypothetical protein
MRDTAREVTVYEPDPTLRFSLDAKALVALKALAGKKGVTVAALLRDLVYKAIHQEGKGTHDRGIDQ